jgi:hypothetical protein
MFCATLKNAWKGKEFMRVHLDSYNSNNLSEFDKDSINLRIEAVSHALKRARVSFLVATFVSLTVIIAVWNCYLSWYRGFVMPEKFGKGEVTTYVQQQLVAEWVKSQTINIQPLGITVGIADAAALATISLVIIIIWGFYNTRSENYCIASLLRDTKDITDISLRRKIYYGIISHLVFLDVYNGDEPIKDLADNLPTTHKIFVRGTIKFLTILPAITIFIVILFDVLSITSLASAYRTDHGPLFDKLTSTEWMWLFIFDGSALILGFFALSLCKHILGYEEATAKIIMDYSNNSPQQTEHFYHAE